VIRPIKNLQPNQISLPLPLGCFEQKTRAFGTSSYTSLIWPTHTDQSARVAIRALYEQEDPERYRKELDQLDNYGPAYTLRKQHRTFVLEMMLSRAAENFLAYLTELLVMVFTCRPEMLRSSETVRLEAILKHPTMEELIHELAERRVLQLSYQGMRDVSKYLSDHIGFDLTKAPDDLDRAVRIIEARNLIVHNRGIVNEIFLRKTADLSAKIGEPLELSNDQIFDDLDFIAKTVYDVDVRAVQKFGLSPVPKPSLGLQEHS
jgi:hypothetical protein